MTGQFTTQDYWERRLRKHFTLEGVGYLRLGRRFNEWMYRIRGDVFDRVAAQEGWRRAPDQLPQVVADIGAGTGFYTDRWLRLGANVTGVDLTAVAVEHLASQFPTGRFVQCDIGLPLAAPLAAEAGRYDVISAFDVLFHIVDDVLYDRALANIATLLKPGGTLVWSDNFVHQPTVRVTHQVSRSLADIAGALDRAGLEIVRRVPMFVLMNYPADTTSRLARWAWTAMVAPAMVSDLLGGALGALLYPLERRLVAGRSESASTELMICRRRA